MNLNQLRIFHAVASLNSFTRASEQLFLTQPGVSKHIKQLEDFFGVPLFDRLGKRVVPTQAGDILFESTKSIFKLIDDAKVKIDDMKGMAGGKITIGASFTAGTYILPELIGRFNKRYPDVAVSLDISLSFRVAKKVLANDLDIGCIGAPYEDERLRVVKFREDRLVAIVSENHPWKNRKSVEFGELTDQPLILSRKGSGTRAVIEKQAERTGIKFKKIMAFGNTESVKQAVVSGIGISVMSESAIANEVKLGRIQAIKLCGEAPKRAFYYTYHKDKYLTRMTKALIDLFKR